MPPPTRGEVAGEGGAFEASASTAPLSPASNYEVLNYRKYIRGFLKTTDQFCSRILSSRRLPFVVKVSIFFVLSPRLSMAVRHTIMTAFIRRT